jgi:hypothetical protein
VKAVVFVVVPPTVVTDTDTLPAIPAGVTALMVVVLVSVKVAVADPNLTVVAKPRLVPVMVTVVPPAVEPLAGVTLLMVGAPT